MKVEHVRDYVVERLPYALNPRSIAVVGASRYTTKVGYKVIEGLKNWGYQGKIYPVNPRTSMMHGMKAYPRVCDIPDEVDLVFIAVPGAYRQIRAGRLCEEGSQDRRHRHQRIQRDRTRRAAE